MDQAASKFNETLDKFIAGLETIFGPNDVKLSGYKAAIGAGRMFGINMPSMFLENAKSDKVFIFSKDHSLFTSTTSFASSLGISSHWDTLEDTDKNNVWEYLQTLYLLSYIATGNSAEEFEQHLKQ